MNFVNSLRTPSLQNLKKLKFSHDFQKLTIVIIIIVIIIPAGLNINNKSYLLQVNDKNTNLIEEMNLFKVNSKDVIDDVLDVCIIGFEHSQHIALVFLEQINVHQDYNYSKEFSHCFTPSFLEKMFFSKIFMELLMEDKEKVMGDYLCNFKFTVSKT